MMIHEFTELTGFEPSMEEYKEIEEQYYSFDGDKKAFCKDFVKNGGIQKVYDKRLATIQQMRSTMIESEKSLMQAIKEKEDRIASLEAELEKEQEWQPYEDEHNVKQADYERLEAAGARVLSDNEAADMIAEEFGFDRSKIVIVHEVLKEEVNRHRRVRTVGKFPRKALFEAWDWNYIVFNVKGNVTHGYEMYNGELQQYWG